MKKIMVFLFFFLVVSLQACKGQSDDSKLLKEVAFQDSTLIVDVRTIDEYKSGHLSGSINIPLDVIEDSISNLRPYKNLIVVCRSGTRSEKAKKILKENGFQNVSNGGGWTSLKNLLEEE